MSDPAPLHSLISGQCLCGAVQVQATPVQRHVEACHCAMCRRWTGGAFLGIQCGGEVEISGEAQVVRYRSSDWAERGFCGKCGSNLFYHYLPDGHYTFAAGLFPDEVPEPISAEIFIDEQPPYYAFTADGERLTGAEIMAKFGAGDDSVTPPDG